VTSSFQLPSPSYVRALRAIWDRSSYDRGFVSNPFAGDEVARLGLRRTDLLLERLGHPELAYPIVHVAGSKGKGSTCAFAARILQAAGMRTGLTTSPHLHSFRERIVVDGDPVSFDAFALLCKRAIRAAEGIERDLPEVGRITAFELMIAMALDHFARAGCDAAVVEVGLGGTLDATNVVMPVASLITTLDLEHTEVLGHTIAEIATNKAGIIKPGIPVATAAMPAEAQAVVAGVAESLGSPWLLAGRDWSWRGSWRGFDLSGPWGVFRSLRIGLVGDHQVENAALAVAGLWLAFGNAVAEEAIRAGLAATRWLGRFEVVTLPSTTVVLDGAHTPVAARALLRAFTSEFPGRTATVVLGVLRGKEPTAIADALAPIASSFVAVTPPGPRGLPADELARSIASNGKPVTIGASIDLAIRAVTDLVLVTGSLTTVAAAREALGLAIPDPTLETS
jgi:dihydrofolate synthase/folylpolyglutamate synthase